MFKESEISKRINFAAKNGSAYLAGSGEQPPFCGLQYNDVIDM